MFQRKDTWDAVFSYGIDANGNYYDWFAFRDIQYPLGAELLGDAWWHLKKRLLLLPRDNWYPVYSAFGGIGIYKKSSLVGCKYSGLVTEDLNDLMSMVIEKHCHNPLVGLYFENKKTAKNRVNLGEPRSDLWPIHDYSAEIVITPFKNSLSWRLNSGVKYYPITCEHVSLHAAMIKNGHDRLFVSPRIIFKH